MKQKIKTERERRKRRRRRKEKKREEKKRREEKRKKDQNVLLDGDHVHTFEYHEVVLDIVGQLLYNLVL